MRWVFTNANCIICYVIGNYATEKEVHEALHQTGIDEKIAWHIASAVHRLIAIDPERFSIPV